ncbi:hypothetical protein Tco_0985625 [Tanacetum coccineum]
MILEDDVIFTFVEPVEEKGLGVVEVPALKEEEFAQITVSRVQVSFPNGHAKFLEFKKGLEFLGVSVSGQECGVTGFVNAFFSTTLEATRDFENEDRSDLNALGCLTTG